jgi:hypothetical protein
MPVVFLLTALIGYVLQSGHGFQRARVAAHRRSARRVWREMVAAPSVGAAAGNMIAIHNVAATSATSATRPARA